MITFTLFTIVSSLDRSTDPFYWSITGGLATAQTPKPKIVITPVISQISPVSNSGATATVVQTQPPKHTANLLLPVTIPQQSGPAKQGMFNLKINNGQISTEGKGTITGEDYLIALVYRLY